MTATKTRPVSTPVNKVTTKEYRLTRENYPEIQRARGLVKLEKMKAREYTNDQGFQDISITYRLNDRVFTAETLTIWGHVIAGQLANKIEQWTPNESVYHLTALLSTMKNCNPGVEADITKLPSARIDFLVKGLVAVVDNAGFGLNLKGDIINIDETLASIEAAGRLGMKFVKE